MWNHAARTAINHRDEVEINLRLDSRANADMNAASLEILALLTNSVAATETRITESSSVPPRGSSHCRRESGWTAG